MVAERKGPDSSDESESSSGTREESQPGGNVAPLVAVLIEDGVPIPPPRRAGRPKTPMACAAERLKIGQSIVCESWESFNVARERIKKLGGRYTSRKLGGELWRIWRIE